MTFGGTYKEVVIPQPGTSTGHKTLNATVLRSSSRRSKLLAGAVEEPANVPSYIKPILCTQVEVLL
jgi:hypothetical protein